MCYAGKKRAAEKMLIVIPKGNSRLSSEKIIWLNWSDMKKRIAAIKHNE
jgi:hypothetical protein